MQIATIKQQLDHKKAELLTRKQRMIAADPFGDVNRLENNAAIDADAAEQFDHENVSALLEEVDRKLMDVDKALVRIETGTFGICAGCGDKISEDRILVDPVAEYCFSCQQKKTVVDVG